MDLKNFTHSDQLKNGLPVTIRSVRPDDKERIKEAFSELEAETIYTRFFQFKTHLTDEELKRATEVDFDAEVALVVTIQGEDDEIIIGGSRYSVLRSAGGGPKSAEVAFTVEEDYHGQGIASRLFNHMINIARQRGIDHFEAEVLPGNNAMLTVFKRSGLPLTKRLEDGAIHLSMSLHGEEG